MKEFQDKCLNCKTTYWSIGVGSDTVKGDGGLCESCRDKESKQLSALFRSDMFTKPRPKQAKIMMPKGLTESELYDIMEFVCESYGVLFEFKTEAYIHVNKYFELNLTKAEVLAICVRTRLEAAGLDYKYKKPPSYNYKT